MLRTKNPLFNEDVYKTGHITMQPPGVTSVYSVWTPRRSRLPGIDYAIFFGMRNYVDHLTRRWAPFFSSYDAAANFIAEYSTVLSNILGYKPEIQHFFELFHYGRLPITVKGVPEGTKTPIRVAQFYVKSTAPQLSWVTQFLETDMSAYLWKPITSATLSVERRRRDNLAVEQSGGPVEMLPYLNHDFSNRGMSGMEDAIMSGMGHLVGSNGTDTVAAVVRLQELYGSWHGKSIAASEHAVMCIDGPDLEFETVQRILRRYPDKAVSVVADTWNLWKFVTEILPKLGTELTDRTVPLVVRPDSGDPIKILTGNPQAAEGIERHGLVPYLLHKYREKASSTTKGYALLPPFLGTVYGDSMNPDRCDRLNEELLGRMICPTNTVRGIGSFTYEYQTRDSLGQALKAVQAVVNGETRDLFKDPITDSGEKKSPKGRVGLLFNDRGEIVGQRDQLGPYENDGFSETYIADGILPPPSFNSSFQSIRGRTGVW